MVGTDFLIQMYCKTERQAENKGTRQWISNNDDDNTVSVKHNVNNGPFVKIDLRRKSTNKNNFGGNGAHGFRIM